MGKFADLNRTDFDKRNNTWRNSVSFIESNMNEFNRDVYGGHLRDWTHIRPSKHNLTDPFLAYRSDETKHQYWFSVSSADSTKLIVVVRCGNFEEKYMEINATEDALVEAIIQMYKWLESKK